LKKKKPLVKLHINSRPVVSSLFEIVVGSYGSKCFSLEIHQNDIFFFIFKKLFSRSVHQNDLKTLIILNKIKLKQHDLKHTPKHILAAAKK
jgi:hypothetical protein